MTCQAEGGRATSRAGAIVEYVAKVSSAPRIEDLCPWHERYAGVLSLHRYSHHQPVSLEAWVKSVLEGAEHSPQ